MKLVVNGIEVPVSDRVDVRLEVDPKGEQIEQMHIEISGGRLTVMNGETSALVLCSSNEGQLRLVGGRDDLTVIGYKQ